MSGLTPQAIYDFRRALQGRGSSIATLADEVGVARHHLSQCLWGHFAGAGYWAKVRACVTAREWSMLLQQPHVAEWQAKAITKPLPYCVRWVCGECGTGLGFRAAGVDVAPGVVQAGICPACNVAAASVVGSKLAEASDVRECAEVAA